MEMTEYSPVGEGLGMRDLGLYVWMRRISVVSAHVLVLVFTVLIAALSHPGTSLFSWHPFCMSFGFCLCMTEGILLFSSEATPFCLKSRQLKVRAHWLLQALLVVSAATGAVLVAADKSASGQSHLTSWHGALGAATLASTALQAGCGLLLLLRFRPQPELPRQRRLRLRLYHATCGLLTYLLAAVTVVTGLFSDWFQAAATGATWYVFLLLPLFPALVVMNQITNAFLPKKKITH